MPKEKKDERKKGIILLVLLALIILLIAILFASGFAYKTHKSVSTNDVKTKSISGFSLLRQSSDNLLLISFNQSSDAVSGEWKFNQAKFLVYKDDTLYRTHQKFDDLNVSIVSYKETQTDGFIFTYLRNITVNQSKIKVMPMTEEHIIDVNKISDKDMITVNFKNVKSSGDKSEKYGILIRYKTTDVNLQYNYLIYQYELKDSKSTIYYNSQGVYFQSYLIDQQIPFKVIEKSEKSIFDMLRDFCFTYGLIITIVILALTLIYINRDKIKVK